MRALGASLFGSKSFAVLAPLQDINFLTPEAGTSGPQVPLLGNRSSSFGEIIIPVATVASVVSRHGSGN